MERVASNVIPNTFIHYKQSSRLFLRKSVYFALFVCLSLVLVYVKDEGGNRFKRNSNVSQVINSSETSKNNKSDVVDDDEPAPSLLPAGSTQLSMAVSSKSSVISDEKVSRRTTLSTESVDAGLTDPVPTHSEPLTSSSSGSTTARTTEATSPSVTTGGETVRTTEHTSATTATTPPAIQISSTVPTTSAFCEPPAYHEFPEDLFSNQQKRAGFVVIHILVGVYMFFALAVVCDEYFVASMEQICVKLGVSEDVAGASFMAAGSSAPELFASLLGVFVAKGDVGTGTIVGSAVFNILFVIGFCALFAGRVVALNWWPLIRDSAYYSIAVILLISIMADGMVSWWESLIMLIFYGIYLIIMKFNVKIHIWLTENTKLGIMDELTQCSQGILLADGKEVQSSYVQFNNYGEEEAHTSTLTRDEKREPREMPLDEIIRDYPRRWSLYESALKVMHSRRFSARTRFICAALRVIQEWDYVRRYGYPINKQITINQVNDASRACPFTGDSRASHDWKRPPSIAEHGVFGVIRWGITTPLHATLYYTIPDCKDPAWEKWFMFTFFVSMVWIAFFSYILVWMVTLVGYTFGIPDTIMGITFLAAGTSIPDAYSSLLVAKQGLGDMAVSNSIGSNVFDILIGLALPWFIQTALVEPGTRVAINSGGMVYNVILLFLSIIATIIAVHYARWQLNKRLGICLMITYVIFLTFSLLIEFNVFGYVNPPECEED